MRINFIVENTLFLPCMQLFYLTNIGRQIYYKLLSHRKLKGMK